MLLDNLVHETHYAILSVREDANYEEIRRSYRSAILDSHPDKTQNTSKTFPGHELENRFLEVQRAWEILSNSKSRAAYDSELRIQRQEEFVVAEDIGLEDLMVQSKDEVLELFYQCRCGDYFSIDSSELEEMGYRLLREGSKISLQMSDALPSSVLLSCGSCSLQIRLLINGEETNDPPTIKMATDGIAINPDRIQTFFDKLETRKSLLTTITHLHQTLTHHFSVLDQSLSQKTLTLESQIQALDSHTKETLDSLQIRENAIPDRLSAASARIKKQEQAAIMAAGDSVGERRLLEKYCRNMDWKGLLGFVLEKKGEAVGDREEGSALREKIAAAVAEVSVDGMRLVLEAVEEFVDSRVKGEMMAVADRRWACGVLIQAVVETGRGDGDGGVGRGMKEKAVGVLEKWKEVMAREKNGGFGAGEARMFLQIVIGFGLKEMVGEEYLRKLLLQFTTKRHIGQFAKLAVTLGLGDQVKGIVEGLAISRKTAHIISKTGKYITAAVEEADDLELKATMAMIKSAEDKLESKSTIDSLWKRVQQLEKAKEENKKSATTSTSKPPNKRGRGGGGGPPSYRSKSGRFSNASPSFRSPQAAPATFRTQYNYASRNMYEGPGPALYAPGYGAAAGARAVGSYAGPRNYGPHDPSAAAGPAYPPYQGYHH